MAFYSIDAAAAARFNSAVGHKFLTGYQSFVDNKIREENERVSSRTFAPSSFRCDRRSWFRLRGTQPDIDAPVDRSMAFMATLGTACHQTIQRTLIEYSGNDDFEWVPVEDYLRDNPIPYEYTVNHANEYETQIEIHSPFPVKFACDGIVKINGVYYLLEIKTSEHSSFALLTSAKQHHVDQVKLYSTLLNLENILMIYQDRQYGDLKVYTYTVKAYQAQDMIARMKHVMTCVESNIAPDPLPRNDPFCNGCVYARTCSQWGR